MDKIWFLEDNSFSRPFTSEDYAVLLGLKTRQDGDGDVLRISESERLRIMRRALSRTEMDSQDVQDVVWSQFCVSYLPTLVERVLEPPSLLLDGISLMTTTDLVHNVYSLMLLWVSHVPYFSKFMQSTKAIAAKAKSLPSVWARRLLICAPTWERVLTSEDGQSQRPFFEASCRIMLLFCTTYVNAPDFETLIPPDVKSELRLWLSRWAIRYPDEFGMTCGQTSAILSPNLLSKDEMRAQFKNAHKLLRNSRTCGLPGCDSERHLKTCGRCETIRYCSTDHQAQHWKYTLGVPHRRMCHSTEY